MNVDSKGDPFAAIAAIHAAIGVRFLLILDQFERYVVRHSHRLLERDRNTFIATTRLVEDNAFWRAVGQQVSSDRLSVLFSVPQDMAFALEPFQFGSTARHWLKNIDAADVRAFLTSLGGSEAAGAIERPTEGWTSLVDKLIEDLTEKDGRVLGAQLRVALQGIAATMTNRISEHSYLRAGGLRGIEARSIKQASADTAARFAMAPARVLALLNAFVDLSTPAPSSRALTVSELLRDYQRAAQLGQNGGAQEEHLRLILNHLDREWNLVRAHVDQSGQPRWRLVHDYLATTLSRVHRAADVELNERHKEFRRAGRNLLRRWHSLLPPVKQLTALRDRALGRLRFNDKRGFVLLSLLRWLPYGVLFVLVADHGVGSPRTPSAGVLDTAGLSVFRPISDESTIDAHRARLRSQLESMLLAKASRRVVPEWSEESWGSGQMAYALACATKNKKAQAKAAELLESLFTSKLLVRDTAGKAFGWQRTIHNQAIVSPPAFWIGAAAARHSWVNTKNSNWLTTSEQVGANFINGSAATFYPRQRPPHKNRSDEAYSTYSTVLALTYLLELQAVQGDRFDQIEQMVTWLWKHHRDDALPGWTTYPTRTDRKPVIVEGLTLQTYAVLLRAHTDAHVALDPRLLSCGAPDQRSADERSQVGAPRDGRKRRLVPGSFQCDRG